MAATEPMLSLLPYLQSWDGDQLHLRVLLCPRDSMIEPYVGQSPPWPDSFFPQATLKFSTRFYPGFENLPGSSDGDVIGAQVVFDPLPTATTIFTGLKRQYEIDTSPPAPTRLGRVRKHLTRTYQDASGYVPSTSPLFSTDNTYSCHLKKPREPGPFQLPPLPTVYKPSWGKLIATMLRVPEFAEKAGLVRTWSLKVDPAKLKDGGFLFFTIDPDAASKIGATYPGAFKTYATRIPALDAPRALFSPVFFPLTTPENPSGAEGDDVVFAEVDEYADGWAKAVHCVQPQQSSITKEEPDGTRPVTDLGVRIGWDDEQVTRWLDRQLDPNNTLDCPLGVSGYRVDVRASGSETWLSLNQGQGKYGPGLGAGNSWLGSFTAQLGVEVHPIQSLSEDNAEIWMPMYFTNWSGSSLIGLDTKTLRIMGREASVSESQTLSVSPGIELRYGMSYQFRVRLVDHTGGGPDLLSPTSEVGPSPVSRVMKFRRWIRPLAPILDGQMPVLGPDPTSESDPQSLSIRRPQLQWPALGFTGAFPDLDNQIQRVREALIEKFPDVNGRPEITLPDPNATQAVINVWVQTLPQDPEAADDGYMLLYRTLRFMPSDPAAALTLTFDWQDVRDIYHPDNDNVSWAAEQRQGPLVLPRSRLIKLRVGAYCGDPPNIDPKLYYGAEDVRSGPEITIPLRKNATVEKDLYTVEADSRAISAFFLQKPPPPGADPENASLVGTATARLASELDMRSVGTTLRSRPGERVVFACTGAIRHVLGPDRASISFPSDGDLIRQWIVVMRLTIERDWTWNGLQAQGIAVERGDLDDKEIIRFSPTYSAGLDAIAGSQTDRTRTHLVIIDAIDPKPTSDTFPQELNPSYTIKTSYLTARPSPAPITHKIRIPVTTVPRQTPKVASVGFAMSPYTPDSIAYSSTSSRKRMIWIEFAEELHDPDDRYFARVLRAAPDPLLANAPSVLEEIAEPDLPIDPELARRVVPRQANDNAGLTAMQPLIPSDSPLHWGLPLPEGLEENSLELFGYFTYEFRVGHWNDDKTDRWCTAQGRYGAPQRLAGVQHPYPELSCFATRAGGNRYIRASAPYARPASTGLISPPILPSTQMCFLIYAQAAQLDASGQYRNILLQTKYADRPPLPPPQPAPVDPVGPRPIFANPNEDLVAHVDFNTSEIQTILQNLGFTGKTGLSVLAVEMERQAWEFSEPLGRNLGRQRIMRTSNLVAIASTC